MQRLIPFILTLFLAAPAAAQGTARTIPGASADVVRDASRRAPEVQGRTPAPESLPGPVFAPGGRPFFSGAFLGDAETKMEVIDVSIRRFTEMVGKRPALVKSFHAFNADFSSRGWAGQLMDKVRRAGSTNYLALAPAWTSEVPTDSVLAAILAGSADDELRRMARDLKSFGSLVLVEPGWEMNGRWGYRWQGVDNGLAAGAPAKYVAAWRRVVDTFTQEGVTNVRWVFNPNTGNPVLGGAPGPGHWNWWGRYYPGDEYVDYVGFHGFNGPSVWFRKWMTFAELFSGPEADYALPDLVRRYPAKPVIMGEFAAEKDPEHLRRGDWIRDAYRQMIEHPKIVGGIWFHMEKETDWRVNTLPQVLEAYREVMRDPRVLDRFVDVSPPLPRHGRR
ncbi:MAG TPA: glycosyl hydrolase [Longimicrobium sp.]